MNCNDDFRHVCFKDLEHYFKKDEYFGDLSEDEIKLIQKNLGIINKEEDPSQDSYNPTVIISDYDSIYNLTQNAGLKVGYVYIINDYSTIYIDKRGEVHSGEEFYLILNPSSTSTFDKRVALRPKEHSTTQSLRWIVEYDITPVTFQDGSRSKGTITYLKDQNNNSAYYDFKNIKFLLTVEELSQGPKTYTEDQYVYTFDIDGQDASNSISRNNHLEQGVTRTVFLNEAQNNTLAADCHDNIFFGQALNNTFDYGTYNNVFKTNIQKCRGSVHDKVLAENVSMSCPKEFNILNDKQVLVYLDSETQTFQFINL